MEGLISYMSIDVKNMTLEQLESLLIQHSAVIRAIPKSVRIVVEKRHMEQFPNAEIKYLPEYRREMLVEERQTKHGGEFALEIAKHTHSRVDFQGKRFFKSLTEVIEYLTDLDAK